MKNIIEISKLSKSFPSPDGEETVHVFNEVDLVVETGSSVAIVGPSGCGKSTVTRLVAGLLRPNVGGVWLKGEPVTSPRDIVGMAFQNPVLLEWRSILNNVMLPLEIVLNS